MRRWRFGLGAAGLLLGLYGGLRLATGNSVSDLLFVCVWLGAVVVVHDLVMSPLLAAVGGALTLCPPRVRRALQRALLVGGLLTVVAIPLMLRQGSQPSSKSLLVHDYRERLAWLLLAVAVVSLLGYVRERVTIARPKASDSDSDEKGP